MEGHSPALTGGQTCDTWRREEQDFEALALEATRLANEHQELLCLESTIFMKATAVSSLRLCSKHERTISIASTSSGSSGSVSSESNAGDDVEPTIEQLDTKAFAKLAPILAAPIMPQKMLRFCPEANAMTKHAK